VLTNNQLHETLAAVSRRHNDLKAQFADFANLIEARFTKPDFFVKGITVKPVLDSNYIEVGFAGRMLHFVFSSFIADPDGALVGLVHCYLVLDVPEKKLMPLRGFSFKPDGESDILNPEDGRPLCISSDTTAIYLALHLINESLSK
jgi:hypothetical protein